MTIAEFRQFLRRHPISSSIVDRHSYGLLVKELKTRIRRKQKVQLQEVKNLIHRAAIDRDVKVIQPILSRCYLQGRYRDHEEIRFFLKGSLDRWPSISILEVLKNGSQSLDKLSKNPRNFSKISMPHRPKRELPSLLDIVQTDSNVTVPDLLEIKGQVERDLPELNFMLQRVIKLYHFIQGNSFLHSRNFQPFYALIPTTVFGEPISEKRVKNIIKKKISYVRTALVEVPPMECKDSEYLTGVLDDLYKSSRKWSNPFRTAVRREYKKFLRKTYTIDPGFEIHMNKYAYIRAVHAKRDYFSDCTTTR